MLNTSEVSLPAEVKIASSPPGCSLKNLLTSRPDSLTPLAEWLRGTHDPLGNLELNLELA